MNTDINLEQEKFQTGGVVLVASAHAVHDTYTGFLPALLPLLIQKFSLTNTTAGLLSLFMQIPSVIQPFIGSLADRRNLRLLVVLGPAITGFAMSMLGIAPGYGFLAFLLILAGISSSSLHAVGPVMGSHLSGSAIGKGMSIWMVGGELGRAFGPLIVVTALGFLTLEQLPWLMLAGLLMSVFLHYKLNYLSTRRSEECANKKWSTTIRQMRSVMLPLSFIIFTRSLSVATLSVFLPTFLTSEGSSLWLAGASLTILQMAGVLGAFTAGSLSDRFGRRKMLLISYLLTPIFMILLLQSGKIWLMLFLVLTGFFSISVIPVFMAIVMENFSENRSTANGIYMFFNFILQAVGTFLAGQLGDLFGLRTAFLISALVIPLGLPFIFKLPRSLHKQIN